MVAGLMFMSGCALLVSMAVFVWAWQGKKIDDHPLCGRCGFDLVGRPEGSEQCSECGADLSKPWAVIFGHRVKRMKPLVWAGMVFLISGAAIGTFGVAETGKIDLHEYKPVWWLGRELGSTQPAVRLRAYKTLERLSVSSQSVSSLLSLADRLLEARKDVTKPFSDEQTQFLLTLKLNGHLPEATWRAYAESLIDDSQYQCRPIIGEGQDLLVASYRAVRPWTSAWGVNSFPETMHVRVDALLAPAGSTWSKEQVEGLKWSFDKTESFHLRSSSSSTDRVPWRWVDERDSGSLGKASKVYMRFVFRESVFTGGRVLATVVRELPAEVTVLPAGQEYLQRVRSDGLEEQLLKAIDVEVKRGGPGASLSNSIIIGVNLTAPLPANVSYEVILRTDGVERTIGCFTSSRSSDESGWTQVFAGAKGLNSVERQKFSKGSGLKRIVTNEVVLPGTPTTVDVILRPTAGPALLTADIVEYADVELLFRGVPVMPEFRRLAR